MNAQSILVLIVIGLVAGWLASFVVGGGGLLRYLISGLVGSIVGSLLLQVTGLHLPISNPIAHQIAVSTIGAIIAILAARLIA